MVEYEKQPAFPELNSGEWSEKLVFADSAEAAIEAAAEAWWDSECGSNFYVWVEKDGKIFGAEVDVEPVPSFVVGGVKEAPQAPAEEAEAFDPAEVMD